MSSKNKKGWQGIKKSFTRWLSYLHDHVTTLNGSKFFAGLMVITLNIASKFVHIKLGKSLESYLKYSFSRNILVFAIAWMGTRDIYVAFIITITFFLLTEHFLHEDSSLSILSDDFKEHHMKLVEEKDSVTEEEIVKAKLVLEKAEQQKQQQQEQQDQIQPFV